MSHVSANMFRGCVNKDLTVDYSYDFTTEGKFSTISQLNNGTILLRSSYLIVISEGYGKGKIFVGSSRYYHFAQLLKTATKTISDNLYDIFPGIGKMEYEIDSRTLQIYQTEKAMSTAGFTAMPAVYVDATSTCYPGIRIETAKGYVTLPLEDAIPIANMLSNFDPNAYGLSILRILGKVE
jgi:hypothetical protein